MTYGLDMSVVRYEMDNQGNRLNATIPYTMFSALTEFWIAARRAQTATIEAAARPGMFRGSLQTPQTPSVAAASDARDIRTAERTAPTARTDRRGHQWDRLLSLMPADALATAGCVTSADSRGLPAAHKGEAARTVDDGTDRQPVN
ncbi:hypothetical protein [uncultured Paraburkholderia sp.]|uniref:hypothetical protein n=1 Tax=uncultured Paraburkholderia sp. TaxID=1822466 RepID=UPI002591E485|nr:hypothetical protein [uncultured Paraburkholderia sp.]